MDRSVAAVSVAVPVLDGGARLDETLAAVRAQRTHHEVELVIVDSGSADRSVAVARRHGATVIEIPRCEFSHGGTRNLLMERTSGSHVAFLTQDSVPAHDGWLEALLGGFGLAEDVALVSGPYLPRPDASPWVRRELGEFFARFTVDGQPRVDRLGDGRPGPGPATFYSSANGAIARWAWEEVRFRPIAYGEDQRLALDMLAAGLAKAYVPEATVVHSHEYAPGRWFQRVFDEFRALLETFDHRESASPRLIAARIRNDVMADRALLVREGVRGRALDAATLGSLAYQAQRALARSAGSNADRLPAWVRRRCSLEGRASFEPAGRR
jgi:glycosyltransferase involved in cell wall biosynthesis